MLFTGVKHLVDFQDPDYATDYLNRTAAILALDSESNAYALTESAAKYIAVAMAYDDVIRVADLKTRATRFARVDRETRTQFEAQSTPYYATARLWDDGIIEPWQTRDVLGLCLALASREIDLPEHRPVYRM